MKVLGIDWGKRKTGLAVGDTKTGLAEPLKTIFNPPVGGFSIFKNISNKEEIQKIVIGLTGGVIDREIRKFGEKLQRASGLPVEFFDETLTTKDAQKLLIEAKVNRKRREAREDAIAAAIMLELYMEGHSC